MFYFFSWIVLVVCGAAMAADPRSLTLKDSTDLAFNASEAVMAAEARVQAAQSADSRAWAQLLPHLDIQATVGTYRDRNIIPGDMQVPLIPRDHNMYTGQLILSENLFAGFHDVAAIAHSKSVLNMAKMDLLTERDKTARSIIDLYYSIQLDLQSLAAEKETADLRRVQLEEIETRQGSGRATEFDALRARFVVDSQGPRIEKLKAELEAKTLRFARLLGLALDEKFTLADSLDQADLVAVESKLPSLGDAFKAALTHNPALVKMDAKFSSLREQSREQASRHLPNAQVQAFGGTNSYLRDQIATPNTLTYGFQLLITVPIFSGLDSFAERSESEANLQALTHERARTREDLLETLTNAYRSLALSKATIKAQRANVSLAEEAVKRGRVLYRAGRATLSQVLESVSSELDAKKDLGQALRDRLLALADIKLCLGLDFGA